MRAEQSPKSSIYGTGIVNKHSLERNGGRKVAHCPALPALEIRKQTISVPLELESIEYFTFDENQQSGLLNAAMYSVTE